jgi:hypothetical protein
MTTITRGDIFPKNEVEKTAEPLKGICNNPARAMKIEIHV